MPPRDESVAFAVDDAILFARILAIYINHPPSDTFKAYESVRRKPVNDAYKEAVIGWERNKDVGSIAGKIDEILMPWTLMRRRMKARSGVWMFDVHDVEIPPPPALPGCSGPESRIRDLNDDIPRKDDIHASVSFQMDLTPIQHLSLTFRYPVRSPRKRTSLPRKPSDAPQCPGLLIADWRGSECPELKRGPSRPLTPRLQTWTD
jgi:hypothetical protein